MIISISNNHHRHFQFLKKIEELIKYLGNTLKQMMTNSEIFDFFKNNKLIILYLLKNQILEIEEPIFDRIKYQKTYLHFFYPEIKLFLSEEEQSATEKEMKLTNENLFEKFERKRDTGENDDYICSLIRSDSVVEFITHVNQTCAPLSSKIKRSIFETNSFLIDQEPTMLEYAAFFGSVQIFQYLLIQGVKPTSSLWIYAIHSKNAEIINILENENIEPEDNTYEVCFEESIKCHHNEIGFYIEDNLLKNSSKNHINCSIQYFNFSFFPDISKLRCHFYNLYVYGYSTITDHLIKEYNYNELQDKNIDSKYDEKMRKAILNDDTLGIYCLLSVTSIRDHAFIKCSSLTQILISIICDFVDIKFVEQNNISLN